MGHKEAKHKNLMWVLFTSTFKISAFTIGGGYVIVPLMREKFVEELKWIDEREMLDIISISQSSPGPIAINTSLMVGYRMAGIPGAILATLGTTLPPLITISVISFFYGHFRNNPHVNAIMSGAQAAVAAVIFDAVLNMGSRVIKSRNLLSIAILFAAFIAIRLFKVGIPWILLVCGAVGLIAGRMGYGEEGADK